MEKKVKSRNKQSIYPAMGTHTPNPIPHTSYLIPHTPKLKSFTLIEMVIVMIISGIIISIAYFSFFIIAQRFNSFSSSSRSLMEIGTLNNLLAEDFNDAKSVNVEGDEILVIKDSSSIHYLFEEEYILRQQESLIDTFKLIAEKKKYYLNNREFFLYAGKIDELEFNCEYNKELFYFHFKKNYGADQLIHLNKN